MAPSMARPRGIPPRTTSAIAAKISDASRKREAAAQKGSSSQSSHETDRTAITLPPASDTKATKAASVVRSGPVVCSPASVMPAEPSPMGSQSSPDPSGHAGDEFQLAPLRVLVDLVADHHAREPALRADREPVHAAREARRPLHPLDELVLVLELRCLRRDDAHDHRGALPEEPHRLEPPVATEIVPFDQERVVGELAEHALGDRLERALAHPRRAVVPATDVERHGHVVGDALEHRGIGGERGVDEIGDPMTVRLEALDPRRVDEVWVERKVELQSHIWYGREGFPDDLALDPDGLFRELLHGLIGTCHSCEGVEEDGCRWKGHLERVSTRQVRHERRLPDRRRIDLLQRLDDLVDAKLDLLVPGVTKRHRLARPNTRDRVVKGVHEHPAAEFAVGYDVES